MDTPILDFIARYAASGAARMNPALFRGAAVTNPDCAAHVL